MVSPSPQVHKAGVLILLIVGNYTIWRWVGLKWFDDHAEFMETHQLFHTMLEGGEDWRGFVTIIPFFFSKEGKG
jgi:hypothetical protein